MRNTVAIVGGGVAGLTAAHELIERGFEVHVYERRGYFGGKAASYRTDGNKLPAEHGFRFFPSWYEHLTDTLSRIPYHRPQGGRRWVSDNLVDVQSNLLAWFDRPYVALPLQLPRTLGDVSLTSRFLDEFGRLGLTASEVALFMRKLVEFAVMPDDRREAAFEGKTWWEFLECEAPGRSRAYRDLVRASTRTSVAAKAEEASAYTIGRLAIRTLLDTLKTTDRVLNGPTNEVWIQPWIEHLQSLGVIFHQELDLQSIEFEGRSRKVQRLVLEPVPVADARRLRNILERAGAAPLPAETLDEADRLRASLLASGWLRATRPGWDQALLNPGAAWAARAARPQLLAALADLEAGGPQASSRVEVEADFFVLALPLEQVAYYVNRTAMLTFLAPELRDLVRLTRHMDWLSGIQFYLQRSLDVAPGHLVGLDSTWALTAVEHTQFWKDIRLPEGVRAILSVDIAAWDKKGRVTRKEAFNCDNAEIATEVWGQLKEMLNRPDRAQVLRDDMLVGGQLTNRQSFHLDDSVVDLYDRKKQAYYERARSLRFNTLDVVAQGDADDEGLNAESYMWGPRRRFNAEPLLVNRVGSRKLRPGACTSIANLFLAGDYVKTETDLACMEGANEAARVAVNGVLDAAGSREARCKTWPFSPSRQAIAALASAGGALGKVRSAVTAATQIQDKLWKNLAVGLMRVQSRSSDTSPSRED